MVDSGACGRLLCLHLSTWLPHTCRPQAARPCTCWQKRLGTPSRSTSSAAACERQMR